MVGFGGSSTIKTGGSSSGGGGTTRTYRTRDGDSRDDCCRRFLIGTVICLVILGGVGGILYWQLNDDDSRRPIASCGGCHCIVHNSSYASCPVTEKPQIQFNETVLQIYETEQKPLNLFNLTCNPFFTEDCHEEIESLASNEDYYNDNNNDSYKKAVCALHYTDYTCTSYHMVTYANKRAAVQAGGAVTHYGPCGVCSTTQDLAVYLRHTDLTTRATECGRAGLISSYEDGLKCFYKLGFTPSCAKVWMDNTKNTAQQCGRTCIMSDVLNKELNGPPPSCEHNECLVCDEEKSGAVFQRFAGRTRRGSGILSAIARSCDDIVHITHEACPETMPYRGQL